MKLDGLPIAGIADSDAAPTMPLPVVTTDGGVSFIGLAGEYIHKGDLVVLKHRRPWWAFWHQRAVLYRAIPN